MTEGGWYSWLKSSSRIVRSGFYQRSKYLAESAPAAVCSLLPSPTNQCQWGSTCQGETNQLGSNQLTNWKPKCKTTNDKTKWCSKKYFKKCDLKSLHHKQLQRSTKTARTRRRSKMIGRGDQSNLSVRISFCISIICVIMIICVHAVIFERLHYGWSGGGWLEKQSVR